MQDLGVLWWCGGALEVFTTGLEEGDKDQYWFLVPNIK